MAVNRNIARRVFQVEGRLFLDGKNFSMFIF
jgi:hypothetical protein